MEKHVFILLGSTKKIITKLVIPLEVSNRLPFKYTYNYEHISNPGQNGKPTMFS